MIYSILLFEFIHRLAHLQSWKNQSWNDHRLHSKI